MTRIDPMQIDGLIPAVLYTSAGSTGDITLSDSAANYSRIGVYYSTVIGGRGSVEIVAPDGKKFTISQNVSAQASSVMQIVSAVYNISGTTIVKAEEAAYNVNMGTRLITWSSFDQRALNIYRVEGYR